MALTNSQRKQILEIYNENVLKNIHPLKYSDLKSLIQFRLKIKISIPTISRIIKNKNIISKLPFNNIKFSKKRVLNNLEIELNELFLRLRKLGIVFNDKILINLAKKIAPKYDVSSEFQFSRGWLNNFKKNFDIKKYKIVGCSDNIKIDDYSKETFEYLKIISKYNPENLFNIDELGLFYAKTPLYSLSNKSYQNLKDSKKRVTIAFICNMTGSKKFKPILIHKSKKPRGVNIKFLNENFYFYNNSTAWMSSQIFLDILSKIDSQLNHKICLILDNFSGHKIPENILLHNIELAFLPPNTTSLFQALDAGIIHVFKTK